ncbi:MAG: DUF4245 domain-containing protein [Actinocrinis sp.]
MAKAKSRLRTTMRDMVLSLAVIAVPIAIVLAISPSNAGNPVHVIDTASYQSTLSAARQAVPFTLVAPSTVPAGWKLTSEYYQPQGATAADWHLGYLTPSGAYVSVEQTTELLAGFLSDQHSDASPSTAVPINGATPNVWQRYTGTTPTALRTVLYHSDAKSTVIVAGSASLPELEQLAAALR